MVLTTTLFILLQSVSDGIGDGLMNKLGEWSAVIVIIAYLIFQLVRDTQRNKKESLKNSASLKFQNAIYQQLEIYEKVNSQIMNYLKIVTMQYADQISESQMRILVEKVLEATEYSLKSYICKIIAENHIDGNENEIRAKIKQYIENRYKNDVLTFKEYYFRGDSVDKVMDEEWQSEMTKIMIGIVLTQKNERTLQTTLTNKFDQYKNKMLTELLDRKHNYE
jgi:hypothetical protein